MAFNDNDRTTLGKIAQNTEATANSTNIKVPSGKKTKEDIQDDPQYTLLDFITGIAGAAFWGIKSKKADYIKTLISNDNSYFAKIQQSTSYIANAFKGSNQGFANAMEQLSQASVTHPLTVQLLNDNNSLVPNIIKTPSSTETNDKNIKFIVDTRNADEEIIKNIKELLLNKDAGTINDSNIEEFNNQLKKFSTTLKDKINLISSTISDLARSINNTISDNDLKKINAIFTIINNINYAFGSLKNINIPAINLLIRITSKNGEIEQIINNLKALGIIVEGDKIKETLTILSNFFRAISSIADIGFFRRIRMLLSIKFIRTYMLSEVKQLIIDINSKYKDMGDPAKLKGLDNIKEFFRFISALTDKPMDNIGRVKFNIRYIKKHLISSINDLINSIKNTFSGVGKDKDTADVINAVTGFFDKIYNILTIDEKLIERMDDNSEYIYDIMIGSESSIFNLISQLIGIQQNNAEQILSQLGTNFDYVLSILNSTLSLKQDELNNIEDNLITITDSFKLLKKLISDIDGFKIKNSGILKSIQVDYLTPLFTINASIINEMSKADAKNVNKYINSAIMEVALLVNFAEAVKNLSTTVKQLTPADLKIFETLDQLLLNLDDAYKITSNSPNDIAKKLSISDENLKGTKNFDEFIKQLLITAGALKQISTLGPIIQKGTNILSVMITNLAEAAKNIDPQKLVSVSSIFKEVNKILITCSLILLLGSYTASILNIKDIIKFSAGLTMLIGGVSLILRGLSKFGHKELQQANLSMLSLAVLLLTAAYVTKYISEISKTIDWEALAVFSVGLIAFISITSLSLSLIFKIVKISNLTLNVIAFSALIFASAAALTLAARLGDTIKPMQLLAFAGSIAILILATSLSLSLMLKPIGIMSFAAAASLSLLILAAAAAMTLAQHVAETPILSILAFGFTLGLFIRSILTPLKDIGNEIKIAFGTLAGLSLLVLTSTAAMILGPMGIAAIGQGNYWKGFGKVAAFGGLLLTFVGLISLAFNWSAQGVAEKLNTASQLKWLVLISAATMLLGTMCVESIGHGDYWDGLGHITVFAIVLGAFVGLISLAFNLSAKGISGNYRAASQLALLVAVSTTAMLIGTMGVEVIGQGDYNMGFEKVKRFAILLGLFVGGISLAFNLSAKDIKHAIQSALALSILIAVSALALTLPFKYIKDWDQIWQIGVFAAIVAGTVWAFSKIILNINKAFKNDWKKAGVAIMVAAAIGGLIAIMGYAFKTLGKIANDLDGWGFLKLAGIVSLMGGIMWGFIELLKLLSTKQIKDYILYSLSAMVGITLTLMGLSLVFKQLASVVNEVGGLEGLGQIALSLGIMAVTVLVMGGIICLLGQMDLKTIGKGLLVISAAGLLMYGITWLFRYVKDTITQKEIKEVFWLIASMFGTIFALLAATAVLGYLAFLPPVLLGLAVGSIVILLAGNLILYMGEVFSIILGLNKEYGLSNTGTDKLINIVGAMFDTMQYIITRTKDLNVGGVTGFIKGFFKRNTMNSTLNLILGMAHSMQELGIAMSLLGPNPVTTMNNVKSALDTMLNIFTNKEFNSKIDQLSNNALAFTRASLAIGNISKVISKLGLAIQQYSLLSVPEAFDSNGNPTALRQMNNTDFENAAKNIALIITTVGGAIMGLFTGKDANGKNMGLTDNQKEVVKEMMEGGGGIAGFFGMNTKFGKIIKSTSKIGDLISNIALGVQQYASMQIPDEWNNEGKPIHFISITDKEKLFSDAAGNIGTIITLIGETLLTTAKNNPELFEEGLLDDSKISIATNAAVKMSQIVSGIAQGLQAYANLRVPDKWDANGNPIHYIENIDKNKFFGEAGTNISQIVSTIGQTLCNLAQNDKQGIFEFGNNSSTTRVANAVAAMGGIIGTIAESIYNYASGQFPILRYKDGQLYTYGFTKPFTEETWTKAQTNIEKAITCIGMGLFNAINNNDDLKDLIDDEDDLDEFVTGVTKIVNTLSTIINSIDEIIKLNVTTKALQPYIDLAQLYLDEVARLHFYAIKFAYTDDVQKTLTGYLTVIKEWIAIGKDDNVKLDNYNILKSSLNKVFAAIASVKANDEFAKHTNSLQQYVTSLGTIDVSKVESLTSLIDSINKLGDKFKHLDTFTEVLANKLSVVLKDLAIKLDEAKQSILNADALHNKREKLINNAVEKIKELMEQEMIIKIEQELLDSEEHNLQDNGGEQQETSESNETNTGNISGNNEMTNTTKIVNDNQPQNNEYMSNNLSANDIENAITNALRKVLDERNIS